MSKISKYYSDSFNFFRESKKYILFATVVFFFFFLIGFIFPIFFRERVAEFILGLRDIFLGKGLLETIFLIFLNNLQASGLAMILGIGFGIIPLIIGIINGYLVGFVSREAVNVEGISILWRLIPHGIFEIPAVLISIGIGLKLGVTVLDKKKGLKKEIKKTLIFFLFVVAPMLLIAAIVESFLIFFLK